MQFWKIIEKLLKNKFQLDLKIIYITTYITRSYLIYLHFLRHFQKLMNNFH